jgi:hypothetical protein
MTLPKSSCALSGDLASCSQALHFKTAATQLELGRSMQPRSSRGCGTSESPSHSHRDGKHSRRFLNPSSTTTLRVLAKRAGMTALPSSPPQVL